MEALWHSLLKLIEPIVIPDWGSLIGLLPVFIGLLIVLWILNTIRRFAVAGPSRRGRLRVVQLPPAGVHMPGPSWAPILGAGGLFVLLYGLVFGGPLLAVGAAALVAALLYWLREGVRDYDHLTAPETRLPAVIETHTSAAIAPGTALAAASEPGPPPGVHIPSPSFQPLLVSGAMALLVAGLVFGGLILALGVVALIVSLVGWLRDARREYVKTEEADSTGHLEPLGAPATPTRLIGTFGVLIVLAVLVQAGILPPQTSSSGASESARPSASAAGSGAPAADATVVAKGIAYDNKAIQVAAGKPFTIAFRNDDPSTLPHDVDIRQSDGKVLKDQKTITGGQSVVYQYDPLPAGTYVFICSVHPVPNMTGTLTVK